MDSALIPKGVKRCPIWQFGLAIAVVGGVLLWGVYAMLLCWFKGLNQTNMNDYYGFALWIWADLAVIALGGGAFFSGFLKYLVGKDELKNIINYAVLLGFICYSSALLILGNVTQLNHEMNLHMNDENSNVLESFDKQRSALLEFLIQLNEIDIKASREELSPLRSRWATRAESQPSSLPSNFQRS